MLPGDVFNPNDVSLFTFVMGPVVGVRLLDARHAAGQPYRLPIAVWNGAGAARHVAAGTPVAYHPRYHVLSVGAERFNALAL